MKTCADVQYLKDTSLSLFLIKKEKFFHQNGVKPHNQNPKQERGKRNCRDDGKGRVQDNSLYNRPKEQPVRLKQRGQGSWRRDWEGNESTATWLIWEEFYCCPRDWRLISNKDIKKSQANKTQALFKKKACFVLGSSPLTNNVVVSGEQSYIYVYTLSPEPLSLPGCHITLSRVPPAM